MRFIAHNIPILAGTGLALIGIAEQVFRATDPFGHETPLQSGRKAGTTASTQSGFFHFGNNLLGRHRFLEDLAQSFITTGSGIHGQTMGVGNTTILQRNAINVHLQILPAIGQSGHPDFLESGFRSSDLPAASSAHLYRHPGIPLPAG